MIEKQTMNLPVAVGTLVLIALAIIAGNFLIQGPGESSVASAASPADRDQAGQASGSQVRGPGSSPLVVSFEGHLKRHRAEVASARAKRLAEKKKRLAEFRDLPGSVSMATLDSIASCESGGDPSIVSSNGLYHGKYQFSTGTWAAVGGDGLPSEASEAEQDYRAALLYTRSGPGQWPVCGS